MNRDAALAGRIAAARNLSPDPVVELQGGSVNHTFVVGAERDRVVIRFAMDPLRTNDFLIETWCLPLAAAHEIPSPEVLAHGELDGVPYLVQSYVEHLPLDAVSRHELWKTLGTYARRINELPIAADAPDGLFTRFGRDLPAAWQAHLDYNLNALGPNDPLAGLGVYAEEDQPDLQKMIMKLGEEPMQFGLSHGDLAARNVLVDQDQQLVLIDWGAASCGPVPYTDLQTFEVERIHDIDPTPDDLAAYADGYGLDLGEIGATWIAMRKLRALDLVRWALDQRPDRVADLVARARLELRRSIS